jgi:hypothetical protein
MVTGNPISYCYLYAQMCGCVYTGAVVLWGVRGVRGGVAAVSEGSVMIASNNYPCLTLYW